jgi:acyl carrier protein
VKQQLLTGLAEILEVPTVTEDSVLDEVGSWDSLSIVCTIALLDEKAGAEVDGQALAACVTAGDVLRLAGVREQMVICSDDVGDARAALGL